MIKIFWIILILAILYLLALRGRSGHPGVEKLRGWNYTHRGLHSPGVPENSLAAFRAAVDHGYGSEFDVHLLKDGGLDPAKVTRAALQNAASIGGLLLTTEVVIADQPEKDSPAMPGGADMGGMGGMDF